MSLQRRTQLPGTTSDPRTSTWSSTQTPLSVWGEPHVRLSNAAAVFILMRSHLSTSAPPCGRIGRFYRETVFIYINKFLPVEIKLIRGSWSWQTDYSLDRRATVANPTILLVGGRHFHLLKQVNYPLGHVIAFCVHHTPTKTDYFVFAMQ